MPRTKVRTGSKRRGNSVSVNWGEAELNNFITRPGNYAFKVTAAEEGDDGQIIVTSEVTNEGRQQGKSIKTYFNTTPKALWVLARFLEAIGMDIPDSEDDLDLDELVDKEYIGTVEENEYDGKVRLRIAATSYAGIDEDDEIAPSKKSSKKDEEEDDDEKPAKKGKAKPAEEEEEDDEEEEKPAKRGRGRPPGAKNKKKAEVEEDDEEDEDEKPAKGKKEKKGKLPKLETSEVEDMNEEELEDLVDKYGLEDVDLDSARTLRKKAALVLDALESADLLADA